MVMMLKTNSGENQIALKFNTDHTEHFKSKDFKSLWSQTLYLLNDQIYSI